MAFHVDALVTSSAPGRATPRLLFGLPVDAFRMDEAVDRCRDAMETRQPVLIGVLNAAKIVNLRRDGELRDAILDCNMLLADGQAVVWASRLLGQPLPERVAGIDLFEELLGLADRQGRRIYLLGAKPEVLNALKLRIGERWPRLVIAGSHDGYFNDEQAAAIATDIRDAHADMLFLGMPSPKKEVFLRRFQHQLGVPVLHGVGGSFDVLAGLTKRAPRSMQRMGLEWAYRLLQEPGRMWKRYLVTNSAFIALTCREAIRPSAPLVSASARPTR